MPYGHANDSFPSPTRLKKLKALAESELAPRYETEIVSEVELLEAQLVEANKILQRIADTLGTRRIWNWSKVDYDYDELRRLTK